ncbi:hypothetical protein FACS189421_08510 [Bacteroidia bacterium]|nr:hypothetical protein FACS189421_08510 [Bacteroidia bacterium]
MAVTIRTAGSGGGRSYAGAYNQVAAIQNYAAIEQQEIQAVQTVPLPVEVADAALAAAIVDGDESAGVTRGDLDECAMIYPGGSFAWAVSDIGGRSARTCVANVELRMINKHQSVGDLYTGDRPDIILARAKAPSGSSFPCNIMGFPESGWTEDAGKVVFPADREPTIEDVIRVLDEEQKKDAALKIAASTVVGGLVGNVMGANAPGKGGLLGTSKDKMTATAIGALGGGGLMLASTQSGKVAGDMILSTGMNMTFGAMIGNMLAVGDSKIKVENCKLENGSVKKCIWGTVTKVNPLNTDSARSPMQVAFWNFKNNAIMVCDATDLASGPFTKCTSQTIIRFAPAGYAGRGAADKDKYSKYTPTATYEKVVSDAKFYQDKDSSGLPVMVRDSSTADKNTIWIKVTGGGKPSRAEPAAVLLADIGANEGFFGMSRTDFDKKVGKNTTVFSRGNKGEIQKLQNDQDGLFNIQFFEPFSESASDGDIIDFDNKARMQSTLIGGAVGGGLGALSGYQGAQKDIEERWIAAVQQYKDSLPVFYCATGTRFLAQYNDMAIIPAIRQ